MYNMYVVDLKVPEQVKENHVETDSRSLKTPRINASSKLYDCDEPIDK